MSIRGNGIAFDQQFVRWNPMPMTRRSLPPAPIFNNTYSYSSSVTVDNGLSTGTNRLLNFSYALSAIAMGINLVKSIFGGSRSQGATGAQGTAQGQAQTQTDASHTSDITDLNSHFKNIDGLFISWHDGAFKATANGKLIATGTTYDEMFDQLSKYKPEATSSADQPATTTQTPAADASDGAQGNEPASSSDDAAGASAGNESVSTGSRPTSGTRRATRRAGWYRSTLTDNKTENSRMKLAYCQSATEVTNKILTAKMDYLTPQDKADIADEIKKMNPSIFNQSTGKVIDGANWNKLDLPTAEYIRKKYAGDRKTTTTGGVATVSYTDRSGVKHNQSSNINDKSGVRTIQGKNGWTAKYTAKGAVYFDNTGKRVTDKEFKAKCPQIFNSVMNNIDALNMKNI